MTAADRQCGTGALRSARYTVSVVQMLDLSVLAGATRVRCRRPKEEAALYTSADRRDIAALAAALQTHEPTGAYCMCIGTLVFELDGVQPAAITLHHGVSLRWSSSDGNLMLVDPDKVMDWLSSHGIGFVRDEYEEDRRRDDAAELEEARWRAALPASWRPLFDGMRQPFAHARPEWIAAIEAEFPDAVERARVLLELFGNGAGPWSGYPSWEAVPERLLVEMPLTTLVEALDDASNARRCAGALRLFSSWSFRDQRRKLHKVLPAELKARLLAFAATMDDDKRSSVRQTL